MNNLERVVNFLDEAKVYYLATVEGNKPRVRPFGTALNYNNRLYIQTGKVKQVSKQLLINPNAEICAFNNGKWIRISGELINDDSRDAKKAILDKMPELRQMYNEDDDNTQVLYFKNAKVTISSFTSPKEEFEI